MNYFVITYLRSDNHLSTYTCGASTAEEAVDIFDKSDRKEECEEIIKISVCMK